MATQLQRAQKAQIPHPDNHSPTFDLQKYFVIVDKQLCQATPPETGMETKDLKKGDWSGTFLAKQESRASFRYLTHKDASESDSG